MARRRRAWSKLGFADPSARLDDPRDRRYQHQRDDQRPVRDGCRLEPEAFADKITFPVIAERARVNPTTLYRRWGDVQALLEEVAVAALTRDGERVPDTGSLEQDLTEWAIIIARDITRPGRARYLAMVAARVEIVTACPVTETRRDQASEVLRRARERGEKTPTVPQILDHVIAPLYHHVVFALEVDRDYPRRLVSDVLAMVR